MKKRRHEKINELVSRYEIDTQEELADRLCEAGYQVTQATVSRDIRELKLSKVPVGKGRQKYVAFTQDESHLGDKYIRVLREGYVSMDLAQNLLVMKTVPGMAMAVAAAVDALKIEEIVGCIAGDNTIMMAMRNEAMAAAVMDKIERMLEHS
ncbi:MAG: arginine repressor [Lachnospiraceae bacterium]|nr:arginine repressor [Lachnospiraceae bacterium]